MILSADDDNNVHISLAHLLRHFVRADPAQKHVHSACAARSLQPNRVCAVVTQVGAHHAPVHRQADGLRQRGRSEYLSWNRLLRNSFRK